MPEKITDLSIAWLLMAIHFAEGGKDEEVPEAYHRMNFSKDLLNKYKNILSIVFMGDFINRSIFTDSELIIGIQYLLDKGFITVKEDFIVTTEKFLPAYYETAKKMKYKKKRMSLEVIRQIIQD
jgi:hypothetical protein